MGQGPGFSMIHRIGALPSLTGITYLLGSPWAWRVVGKQGADDRAQLQDWVEAAVAPLRAWGRPGHLPAWAENRPELSPLCYI